MKLTILIFIILVNISFAQWKLANPTPTYQNIRGIKIFSPVKYLICTENGDAYITENGGDEWTKTFSDTTMIFKKMYFVNDQTGWIIGDTNRGIFKTTNGGLSWTEYAKGSFVHPYTPFYFDIFLLIIMSAL